MKAARWLLLSSVLLAPAACSDEQIDSALPKPTASSPPPDGGTAGAPPEGERVREVYVRSPLGAPRDNLLFDGDFELSVVPEGAAGGQYGWIGLDASGMPAPVLAETGGLCKSGIRCARVEQGLSLYAQGTAAPLGAAHRGSLWVKSLVEPEPGDEPNCLVATAFVITCDSGVVSGQLKPADAPDEDGWCELAAKLPGSTTALCFYVQMKVDLALVDHGVLLPDDSSGPPPSPAQGSPAPDEIDQATRDKLAEVARTVRARARFGRAPRPPRERAD